MCMACPAKVIKADGGFATVLDAHGRQREIKCPIIVKSGEHVLVGMGHVIERITEEQYEELGAKP